VLILFLMLLGKVFYSHLPISSRPKHCYTPNQNALTAFWCSSLQLLSGDLCRTSNHLDRLTHALASTGSSASTFYCNAHILKSNQQPIQSKVPSPCLTFSFSFLVIRCTSHMEEKIWHYFLWSANRMVPKVNLTMEIFVAKGSKVTAHFHKSLKQHWFSLLTPSHNYSLYNTLYLLSIIYRE